MLGRLRCTLPIALLALLIACPAARADTIRTIEGTEYREDVTAIEAGAGSAIEVRTAARSIPLDQIEAILFSDETPVVRGQRRRAYLRNGDSVRVDLAAGEADRASFIIPALDDRRVAIPLEMLRGIANFEDADTLTWFEQQALAENNREDVAILVTGQDTRVRGALLSVGPDGVSIRARGLGDLQIGWDRVKGLVLARSGTATPPEGLRARVTLRDGSRVSGTIRRYAAGTLTLETEWSGPLEIPRAAVLDLTVVGGRLVYLSDIEPATVVERNALLGDGPPLYPWRRDRSCTGTPIVLDGRPYRKGLGVHAHCELTFRLDGRFREFRVVCGLDDQVYELARQVTPNVVFQVYVDGRPMLGENGLAVGLNELAHPIQIPLSRAQEIRIVVSCGTDFEILARADWADARLIRE